LLQARKMRQEGSGAEVYRKALAVVDAAIARDPNYADAHVLRAILMNALATQYGTNAEEITLNRAGASESANRARAIAPRLGSAYGTLAFIEQAQLNFQRAQDYIDQALALSPDDPEVLSNATNTLEWFGKGQEALRLADRYIALDPLNPQAYRRKSQVLLVLRQYAQSVEAGRKATELAPKASRLWTGSSLLLMGRPGDALAEFKAMSADDPFTPTGQALVAARTGDRAGAERIIARMRQQGGANASYQYAQVYAQLGDKDLALAELDNAFAANDPGLIYLKLDPFLDPIRGDPRFVALVRKLNFP